MKLGKNILLLISVLVLTYVFGFYFGGGYAYFIPIIEAGFFSIPKTSSQYIIGLLLSYTFFLTLLFTAFGGKHKYWWIAILLIPAAVFEIYFDLAHLYFPILLGLAGWLLGLGVCRIRSKFTSPR